MSEPCKYCRKFFAKYRCGMAQYGECDCPKCQGMCECERPETDELGPELYPDDHSWSRDYS